MKTTSCILALQLLAADLSVDLASEFILIKSYPIRLLILLIERVLIIGSSRGATDRYYWT